MQEWNAVISVNEYGFRKALSLFAEFGEVKRTDFFNVLLMRAEDLQHMLEAIRQRVKDRPESLSFLSRLIPITHAFIFRSAEEFESKAKEIVLQWVPQLGGMNFHVRMHRRGSRGKLKSPDIERFLDTQLLEALEKAGTRGNISFEETDTVIIIETIGHWAGLSLISGEYRKRYPFVKVD